MNDLVAQRVLSHIFLYVLVAIGLCTLRGSPVLSMSNLSVGFLDAKNTSLFATASIVYHDKTLTPLSCFVHRGAFSGVNI